MVKKTDETDVMKQLAEVEAALDLTMRSKFLPTQQKSTEAAAQAAEPSAKRRVSRRATARSSAPDSAIDSAAGDVILNADDVDRSVSVNKTVVTDNIPEADISVAAPRKRSVTKVAARKDAAAAISLDSEADSETSEAADSATANTLADGLEAAESALSLKPARRKPEIPTTDAFGQPLYLPLDEMNAAERFAATKRILFVAPDVPPVPPRPRRNNELRKLDEILERSVSREQNEGAEQKRWRETRETDAETERGENQRERSPKKERVSAEPQKVKGSTRLEAKKQRRRDNREIVRRRSVVTESEFLARREAVDRSMVVSTKSDRVQIGVLEDKILVEHYVARASEASLIGNVYLGKVQNVLPSMEAAFVDIGQGRNAVLYSGEVDWSEYTGSVSSRKIEKVLSPGDTVLVQVTKDPVGQKGARLTSQISLPGRFLVYVPGGAMNGISRKLPDTERVRLKRILRQNVPDGAGVIVRTAAEGASEDQLSRDVAHLTKLWEKISEQVTKGSSPALLHAEPDMLIKIVRDVFNEDFQEMIVEGQESYNTIIGYIEQVAPDLVDRIKLYAGEEREIFDKYRVTEQIQKALERKVWLPSGGSLVIDRTEAMTVIDVNTGKFVGSGGNLEETVTKNNLEAAEEIVRQLRLRDSGGIIVIDFIDMVLESNRELVLRRLIECLGRDRTKHQVAEVTSLGLVQMTRKKLGLGLLESFSEACDICDGRGVVVQHDPITHRKADAVTKRRRAKQEKPQRPHEITDDTKNIIAQVAASTIPGVQLPETENTEDSKSDLKVGEKAVLSSSVELPKTELSVVETSAAESLGSVSAAAAPAKTRVPKTRRRVTMQAGETVTVVQPLATQNDTDEPKPAAALNAANQTRKLAATAPAQDNAPETVEMPNMSATAATQSAVADRSQTASAPRTSRRVVSVSKQEQVAAEQAADAVAAVKAALFEDVLAAGFERPIPEKWNPDLETTAAGEETDAESTLAMLSDLLDLRAKQVHAPETIKSRDGGTEELIKKHSNQADKLSGLFDVLDALPEPVGYGQGRNRAEFEARLRQRTAHLRPESESGEQPA